MTVFDTDPEGMTVIVLDGHPEELTMPRLLGMLRCEALEACGFRGHDVEFHAPTHGEYASLQDGTCKRCGMTVHLNTRPMPNGIDIGGEAVALKCTEG